MNKLIIDNICELREVSIYENKDILINLDNVNDNINITIGPNIKTRIDVLTTNSKNKIEINILENSEVIINKLSCNNSDEITINLNGENSSIVYNTGIINKKENIYKQVINHNFSNTSSTIINHAVNISNDDFTFDITASIPKDKINCNTNQDNKIINKGNGKNYIKPNLLVDNNLIYANHSAYIGGFNKEKIFYMMTRGIKKEQIEELLTIGFLLENEKLNKEEKEQRELFIKNNI